MLNDFPGINARPFSSIASVGLRQWMADREQAYREHPEIIEQMDKHFSSFEPKNPDYSHLSDEKPS
jgi:hypothetical protein